jgi:septum formation protein
MTAPSEGLSGAAAPTLVDNWIWLASQSPRRRELLDQIGVAYRLLLPDPHEDVEVLEAERAGESPEGYVRRVTADKLDAALARLRRRADAPAPLLCADTTVAIDGRILGKPRDGAHAREMLRALSGRTHRVITGVAVAAPPFRGEALQISVVRFARWPADAIERYIASGEPLGKAGAYAIQGRAAAFVERIAGSHSSIMGLPLHETALLLRQAGLRV